MKEYSTPTSVYSASLFPRENVFVCGGEDFKIYKFNYTEGIELGTNSSHSISSQFNRLVCEIILSIFIESFKGHFGPVHCTRFSPDGELYASGSEDGTLRLWQTTVGKTYGLWKCVGPEETMEGSPIIKAET